MKELTHDQLKQIIVETPVYGDDEGYAYNMRIAASAIAADRTLNAADRDVMRRALEAFEGILECWNGRRNNRAVYAALQFTLELTEAEIQSLSTALAAEPTPPAELKCKGDSGECKYNGACMYGCGESVPASAEQQPAPTHDHQCAKNYFAFAKCDCQMSKIATLRARVQALRTTDAGSNAFYLDRDDVLAEIDKLGGGV